MLSSLENSHALNHPLVSSAYLNKDLRGHNYAEDVLAIDTNYSDEEDHYESFDSYLSDILSDLEVLKRKSESATDRFRR